MRGLDNSKDQGSTLEGALQHKQREDRTAVKLKSDIDRGVGSGRSDRGIFRIAKCGYAKLSPLAGQKRVAS
jgi:hypothetical protein